MAEFRMPSLGSSMDEGKLIGWRRKAGEHIARGEVIAEIDTDKGAIEVECFESGVVDRLLVEPGAKVPVGTPMAVIRGEGEAAAPAPPVAAPAAEPAPAAPAAVPPPVAPAPAASAPAGAPVRASPMARRRARELDVALESVRGTGPSGAITVEDVEAAARPAAPEPEAAAERMRRAIAATVTRSKREIPHFYATQTIDLTPTLAWLDEKNRALPIEDRVLVGAVLVKAVALAVRQVPELNGHFVDGKAVPMAEVHVGMVVFLRGGGLVAPAMRDVDRKPLVELMRELRDIVERARAGRMRSSELAPGTISVTSVGERGAESLAPVIFPPQVAMVGIGAVVERPWCVAGAVVPRPVVQVTLAADHRVADGHAASRFLRALEKILTEPGKL